MSRVITDLPDELDPVELIFNKVHTCPICGGKYDKDTWSSSSYEYRDAKGIYHRFRTHLNKYEWKQRYDLQCKKCGCHWDTGWYPVDHKMFQITVDGDKDTLSASVNKMLTDMGLQLRLGVLSEEDLQELEDRYGKDVRFVVEDMISGKGKRWG